MTPATEMFAPADVQAHADTATRDALAFVENNRVAVVDLATLNRAVQVRTAIGEKQKAIVAGLAKPKAWAFGLHRWFCSLGTAALTPLALLDEYESAQIRSFKAAEDRRRQQRERELAEQRRRDDEAHAATEAAALETAGEPAMAAAVIAEAIAAPAPVVVLADVTKQIDGLKFTRRWLWRLQNRALVPSEFLALDEKKIGAYARSMKESGRIPGIEIYFVDDPVR